MVHRRHSTTRLLIAVVLAAAASGMYAQRRFVAQARDLIAFSQDGLKELAPIAKKYGPHHSSRNVEEWIIRDYFQDRRGGVFLDVGANHYRDDNNTYLLETQLGWSGVAIDALDEFALGYKEHRPRTKFFAAFVSDKSDATVQFFVPEKNTLVASVDPQFTQQETGAAGVARPVKTVTLDVLLARAGVARLDFMSMDIELSEPKALAGFAIDRFRPALVCIEAHPQVRQEILDYFFRHRYTLVGKYLRADPLNLYFQPAN